MPSYTLIFASGVFIVFLSVLLYFILSETFGGKSNSPAATNALNKILLCDEASAVRYSPDSTRIYATIFKSEEARIKVSESFHSHFNYEIRYIPSWNQDTHPHVYLIDFNKIERDFLLTLSPLIVSMECEIPLNPGMSYCLAIGCTDSGKWPHSFRQRVLRE